MYLNKMLLVAASCLAVSACSSGAPDNESRNLTSPSECKQPGVDEVSCMAAYNAALKNHVATAPRYNSYQSCVAEYGPNMCSSDDTGVFMPMMAGFMISNMMNGQYTSRPLYGYSGHYYDSPSQYRSAYRTNPQVRKTVTSYRTSPSAPRYVQKPVVVPVRVAPKASSSSYFSRPSTSTSSYKPSYSRSTSSSSYRGGFGSSGSSRGSSS